MNQQTRSQSQLDPDSQRLQDEVDQLVRRLAKGDDREYVGRWKQILSWAYNRTQGDPIKKKKLKIRIARREGHQVRGLRSGAGASRTPDASA